MYYDWLDATVWEINSFVIYDWIIFSLFTFDFLLISLCQEIHHFVHFYASIFDKLADLVDKC